MVRVKICCIASVEEAGMGEAELSHETTMALAGQGAETLRRLVVAFCERLAREA